MESKSCAKALMTEGPQQEANQACLDMESNSCAKALMTEGPQHEGTQTCFDIDRRTAIKTGRPQLKGNPNNHDNRTNLYSSDIMMAGVSQLKENQACIEMESPSCITALMTEGAQQEGIKMAGGTDDTNNALLFEPSTSSIFYDQQNPHHKWQKYFALQAVINITFVIVISVLIVFVVRRYEPPEKSNKTCMKCQTLSTIVDKRAWNDVSEDIHSDTCCFNNDSSLTSTLKQCFETRISNRLSETEQQDNGDQLYTSIWNHLLSDRNNTQSKPQYTQPDLSTLMQLINNVFNRNRSALYLTSLNIVIVDGSDPKISWESIIKKGHNSLSNDTRAVSVMTTGLYLVSLQLKFRANIMNNQTVKTTVQFFLAKLREGQLYHVDRYNEQHVFRKRNTEYDANLHTMARLETGDKLIVRIPSSQKSYLASERGAHRLSSFELS